MTAQEDALADLAAFLDGHSIPYMIVGGIANLVWGEPRATLDIDATVLVAPHQVDAFIEHARRRYRLEVDDPERFVRETRVLPVLSATGVRIDLLFGLMSFEQEAVGRARDVSIAGRTIRVCTPEDLILMKIISDRPRDIDDARSIVRRQRAALDLAYLEPRVTEMAAMLDQPEVLERWERWKANKD